MLAIQICRRTEQEGRPTPVWRGASHSIYSETTQDVSTEFESQPIQSPI